MTGPRTCDDNFLTENRCFQHCYIDAGGDSDPRYRDDLEEIKKLTTKCNETCGIPPAEEEK
jgi:hypothetical protein